MNIKTANRLCELRKKHGLSQEDLADKLGVSRQAISKWERSESSPDTDNLIELAKIYGVSLDELLNGDDAIDIINENKESDKESDKINADKIYDSYEDAVKDQDKVFVNVNSEDGDKVVIGDKGIFVESDDGEKVHISTKGIKINDKSIGDLIKEHGNVHVDADLDKKRKIDRVSGTITGLTALLVTIAYILLGVFAPAGFGFAHYWFLFICIPLPGTFYEAIAKRDAKRFCYPLLVTATFCALGMFMGLWHPLWVAFITIPVYYMICDIFKKKNY